MELLKSDGHGDSVKTRDICRTDETSGILLSATFQDQSQPVALSELLDLAFLTNHVQHLGLGETGGIISLILESSKHIYPTGSERQLIDT